MIFAPLVSRPRCRRAAEMRAARILAARALALAPQIAWLIRCREIETVRTKKG